MLAASFDWLDAAEAAGHDYTPTATADWRRAVAGLPPTLHAEGRLEALWELLDRYGERRAALRVDATLERAERSRRLARLDERAARELEDYVDLLREAPYLLQSAYVLAKQTQEEARLGFLPAALVRFGRAIADLDLEQRAARTAELLEVVGDLIERYEGLELAIGDLIHEGVEQRERERARAALSRDDLAPLRALGVERGLTEGRRVDRSRAEELERELSERLSRAPFDERRARSAGRAAFEEGLERGLALALDADRRSVPVLDALTRRVDLGRLARLAEGLADADAHVRRLVLDSVATALGASEQAGAQERREVLREALERVLPKAGPRRRYAECLLDGDRAGADAATLLLELKGLPFDRAAKLEELYRESTPEHIAAFEERFESEHADEVRDARWLAALKLVGSLCARLAGRTELAARLAPVRGRLALAELLPRKLKEVDRRALDDLRRGDVEASESRLLARAVEQRSAAGVASILGRASTMLLVRLRRRYARLNGTPLQAQLERDCPPSASRDLALALLNDNPRLARAARLRAAFADTPGASLSEALEGLDRDQRQQLIDDYDTVYSGAAEGREGRRLRGLFDADLRSTVGRESFPFVSRVLREGGLPPDDLCRYYMVGLGTNESGLLEVLRRLSAAQVDEVVLRYDRKYRVHGARALTEELPPGRAARRVRDERRRFGWRARLVDLPLVGAAMRRALLINGLVGDIRSEVSGDSWFDLRDALRGTPDPERPADTRDRLLERRAHELSGGLVRRWRIFRRMQTRLDADLELALSYYDRHLAPALAEGDPPPAEAARRFHHLAALVLQDFDQFRAIKNRTGAAVGDRLAGVGGTLGGLLAVALEQAIHGTSGLAALMIGGTLGAFLFKFVPKKLIAGDALGTEEIGLDLAHAVVEGAGRMFNRLRRLGAFAVDGIQRGLGRTAFKVGAKRTLDTVTRGVGSRFRARRDRLPELRVASFRLREGGVDGRRDQARGSILGLRLEHAEDAGLEHVFDGLLGSWLRAGCRTADDDGPGASA